jgi:hypothetical protein
MYDNPLQVHGPLAVQQSELTLAGIAVCSHTGKLLR